LRERREDIPILVRRFIKEFSTQHDRTFRGISGEAMEMLMNYPWPGNVRELRNVLFQSLVTKRAGTDLLLSDLPPHIIRNAPPASSSASPLVDAAALSQLLDAGSFDLRTALADLERTALSLALARSGGSPARAARLLGTVGRGSSTDPAGTVRAMLRRHGLG
jgi:DNA-binding NtrC family response regulator